MVREGQLITTIVELADTLVEDFDLVDLLTRLTCQCVEVLDVAAAGIMSANPNGELRVVASSSETMRILELFELQSAEGPCPECFRSGQPIINERLTNNDGRWPHFAPRAIAAGFHSVHAVPMRLRGQIIGALNLFRSDEGLLSDLDVAAAKAFADVSTIAILQHRATALQSQATAEAKAVTAQLSAALNSRIVIEQAKGMVAQRLGCPMERSFAILRNYARSNNLRLTDVATGIVNATIPASVLDGIE